MIPPDARRKLANLAAEHAHASRRASEESAALTKARERIGHAEAAQRIVQDAAAFAQEQCHRQIARVVSRALRAVFGPEAYQFRIDFERKRGRTEARLLFVRDGRDVDPTGAAGGGCVDVAALALRLAALTMARPRVRPFLCLDEPLKHLSRRFQPRARELLEKLCGEAGVQLLFSTHNHRLACGKVVDLEERE